MSDCGLIKFLSSLADEGIFACYGYKVYASPSRSIASSDDVMILNGEIFRRLIFLILIIIIINVVVIINIIIILIILLLL